MTELVYTLVNFNDNLKKFLFIKTPKEHQLVAYCIYDAKSNTIVGSISYLFYIHI